MKEIDIICNMRSNAFLIDVIKNSPSKEWRSAARRVIRAREKKFGYKVI